MRILGISCDYHDSAACLLQDGRLVAAAEEERFSRRKHDASFPHSALRYCLAEGGLQRGDKLDAVAFYDKPLLTLHRILETTLRTVPRGLAPFVRAMPAWLREKLWIEARIRQALTDCGIQAPERVHFSEHHLSHAASAFFPSPFPSAAVLTVDGVGEWATASIGHGQGAALRLLRQLEFPHSLGLLYTACTVFTGFRAGSGEYKLMGLAPFGQPRYVDTILRDLATLHEDGSLRLQLGAFAFLDRMHMAGQRFTDLFGPPRREGAPLTQRDADLARSVQEVTELCVLRMARHARALTGERYLCLAGGVALNCVANGKLLRAGVFDDLWVQPAAGDAGGAVGAALAVWHDALGQPRPPGAGQDAMQGACLGPEFAREDIAKWLDLQGFPYEEPLPAARAGRIAQLLAAGRVVAVLQGRMEFGPRSLGCRSILADARGEGVRALVNEKIKFREGFRPFAPAVLAERASAWFGLDRPSPYMLLVADVAADQRLPDPPREAELNLDQRLAWPRSTIPAVTHVDGSARIQTVDRAIHPHLHEILAAFEALTACPVLLNTSLNLRGEPIACTPEDAYRCFARSGLDALVLGPFVLHKADQPPWPEPLGVVGEVD